MTWHGILPVYKPRGFTSHDIVARIRRLTGQKRVGHTGTLDPEVEGVLPICLGQATRVVEYIQELPKRYQGTFVLGMATDTQDQTGTVVAKEAVSSFDPARLSEVFQQFVGEIEQVPPMFSAVKVEGRRLYDLARRGQEIERPARKVMIYELTCTGFDAGEFPRIHFDVLCSKGTYVRTLCVDIGRAMGYPAHMASLIRTESGPFRLEDSYTLQEIEQVAESGTWSDILTSIDGVLGHFPSIIVTEGDAHRVLDGWDLQVDLKHGAGPLVRVYSESGRFYAIYRIDDNLAKPEKVFRDVEN